MTLDRSDLERFGREEEAAVVVDWEPCGRGRFPDEVEDFRGLCCSSSGLSLFSEIKKLNLIFFSIFV